MGADGKIMSIQAVIWDFGGVLVRTEDLSRREGLARRLGKTRADLEQLVFESQTSLLASLGKFPIEAHWAAVFQALGLPMDQVDEFIADFWGGDVLDVKLVDAIRALRRSYKTGLLSNAFSDLRQIIETRFPITDAFDVMIISAEVGLVKPDPQIYRLALDRLGVQPADAVFIDDFPQNIKAARAVGLHAIHFRSPAQAQAELEQLLNGTYIADYP
jgi:putative hydrolase of the HAD superfamily